MDNSSEGVYVRLPIAWLSKFILFVNRPLFVSCSKINALSDEEYAVLIGRFSGQVFVGTTDMQKQSVLIRREKKALLKRIKACRSNKK